MFHELVERVGCCGAFGTAKEGHLETGECVVVTVVFCGKSVDRALIE